MKRGQILNPAVLLVISIMIVVAIILAFLLFPVMKKDLTEQEIIQGNQTTSLGSCSLTNIYWEKEGRKIDSINGGEIAELVVESENCNGQIIEYEVWGSASSLKRQEVIVTGKKSTALWRAQEFGTIYGVHFIAKIKSSGIFLKSAIMTVNPVEETNETDTVITECNDGIDNDGDFFIDSQDMGCISSEDDFEGDVCTSGELYGTDYLEVNTCEIHITRQNTYYPQDLSELALFTNSVSVQGCDLLACSSDKDNLSRFLSYTKEEIKSKLTRRQKAQGIDLQTTDVMILDMEYPVRGRDFYEYLPGGKKYDPSTGATIENITEAFKLRVEVAREVMPNAKLAIYGTPIISSGKSYSHPTTTARLSGLKRAAELGMFDEVDLLNPVAYMRFAPGDWPSYNHYLLWAEAYTENNLRAAKELKRTDGSSIPIAPLLSFNIFGDKSKIGGPSDHGGLRKQIEVMQRDPDVVFIGLWTASSDPEFHQVYEIMKEMKAVPKECFCQEP